MQGMCTGVVLVDGIDQPADMVLDGEWVYWVTQGGMLERISITGDNRETLTSGGFDGAALVVYDGVVYWSGRYVEGTGSLLGFVASIPSEGGSTTTLADGLEGPQQLAAVPSGVYWLDFMGVYRWTPDAEVVAIDTDILGAFDIVADVREVCWALERLSSEGYIINCYDPASGASVELDAGEGRPTHLAMDEEFIYFGTSEGVSRVPRAGGTAEPVGTGWSGYIVPRIVLMGDTLLVATAAAGGVWTIPKDAGPDGYATRVSPVAAPPIAFAADDNYFYWLTEDPGQILRAER